MAAADFGPVDFGNIDSQRLKATGVSVEKFAKSDHWSSLSRVKQREEVISET